MTNYAELQSISNFSFLQGASHPEELVRQAKALGLYALGIADHNSLSGIVRAHTVARQENFKLIVGAKIQFVDQTPDIIFYPKNILGYKWLAKILSKGKLRAEKGQCEINFFDLENFCQNNFAIVIPPKNFDEEFFLQIKKLKKIFHEKNFYCAANFLYDGFSDQKINLLLQIEKQLQIKLLCTNDVIAHDHTRKNLADILSCIREHKTLATANELLKKNSERFLKAPQEMARIFSAHPHWLKHSIDIVDQINFSLDQLSYQYPKIKNDYDYLKEQSFLGAKKRYGEKIPEKILGVLNQELGLVKKLNYAPYFLTVFDIVNYARRKNILCQGRGSAANSAICYCLGITEVDPNRFDLMFGRFISEERNEPPDIDVDFENGSREEVMQYIFNKYGREHAAITATVITYKKRSALREVAKAFGLGLDAIDNLMKAMRGISLDQVTTEEFPIVQCVNDQPPPNESEIRGYRGQSTLRQVDDALPIQCEQNESELFKEVCREAGLNKKSLLLKQIFFMAHLLLKFPRHLGQHVGGFVINHDRLDELVPIGNAAMEDRTFIEWDKNDLDALGILKIDILALGMLSAIKRSFFMLKKFFAKEITLSNIPHEDKNVYAMLSRADALGVFQVESRAQMSMLPRLKPKTFYDLVIEVAIIRPGPIQGDMVHPFLRRRQGLEKITYPSQALKKVLQKTLGVPLFQEQVMQVAVVGAGFTPGEADQLRRSMATFKRLGTVNKFHERFIDGMIKNGNSHEFAQKVFQQILGFAEYGFPESHAASFANLVYVSAWLKFYYPQVFACALLNSQPMGFYGPAQIIADAKRHGVIILPVCINKSFYENTLEKIDEKNYAIRLGFCEIKGVHESDIDWIIASRPQFGFKNIDEVFNFSGVSKKVLSRLNKAECFNNLQLDDRQAEWKILALKDQSLPLLENLIDDEVHLFFKKRLEIDRVQRDYNFLGFSLNKHPMQFLREGLDRHGYLSHQEILQCKNNSPIKIAGIVLIRQRPHTAKGVTFFTLEDEFGLSNIVIWPDLAEKKRKQVLTAPIVAIKGRLQIKDGVHHIISEDIEDISHMFDNLKSKSRDFR